MAVVQTWNEQRARSWLDGSWTGAALSVRMLTWCSSRTVDYFEPVALPERFASVTSRPHQCLQGALRAMEAHPDLTMVYGFSFREERPESGIHHVWCVGADRSVIDASTRLYGLPTLYLGVVLEDPEHVAMLARLNGLDGPLATMYKPPAQAGKSL